MTEPPERTTCVFAIANRSLTIEDVIAAACFRGDLEESWSRVLFLRECEARAADLGDPDEAALQSASEQFRYERDLITAEETEDWLEARGLTTDDFTNHIVRQYWAGQVPGNAEPASADYLSAAEELRDLLRVELLLSGAFDQLAFNLGARLAALHKSADDIAPDLIEARRVLFLERLNLDADAVPAWLARMQRDEAWLEEMLAAEVSYHLQCADVLTPPRCERMLHALRLPLTRVELEIIEVECLDAANEAILCVREDGAAMSAVAAEGDYPHRYDDRLLEDFSPELQQRLLCAAPGDLLEPIQEGDAFHLIRLNRKIEPALDDSRICARVEREILTRHFTELSSRLVRWQPGFLPR